ncbi:hypothetical protein GCM10010492_45730 [Saccharothrix mutabilis subsp. mutabilis]|uniref:Secreted protein n=1 Tax=Saccharothrix mutabilis subsp. mutabilis TaxID=66855 RepID=A0ABN0U822_9PSEU
MVFTLSWTRLSVAQPYPATASTAADSNATSVRPMIPAALTGGPPSARARVAVRLVGLRRSDPVSRRSGGVQLTQTTPSAVIGGVVEGTVVTPPTDACSGSSDGGAPE